MKKISKKILTIGILGVLLSFTSCEKHLEVPYPTNSINTESAFTGMSTIDGLMSQLYLTFNSGTALSGFRSAVLFLSDEAYNPTLTGNLNLNVDIQAGNITINTAAGPSWSTIYKHIYVANVLLEGIPTATAVGFTDAKKAAYTAAVKAMRAYDYFVLVRYYGDVPLVTTTDVAINALKGRDPAATVYAFIEKELQDAIAALPATAGPKYFINNKYIPQAMLAQLYLYQGKWAQAEAAANDVISSGIYQLAATVNDVFIQSSKEGILVGAPLAATNNAVNAWKAGGIPAAVGLPEGIAQATAEPNNPALSPSLLSSFETGDLRRTNWVTLRNASNYANPNNRLFAYKNKYNSGLSTAAIPAGREEDDKFIRLAEMYLIRAEARARQANISGAATDLNAIRNRAGLGNTTAATQPDMVDAILKERRTELFFEGSRWFDLVRTNTANTVLGAISYKAANWKPYMLLMPLSITDLRANPALTQNPGY